MNEKILVVDDEKEIADLVNLYLSNENFTVIKCYSAGDAMEHISRGEVDLAILDVMLPDMDGFQLCQKIREKYQYPIIMLTAKGEEIDKGTARSRLRVGRAEHKARNPCVDDSPRAHRARFQRDVKRALPEPPAAERAAGPGNGFKLGVSERRFVLLAAVAPASDDRSAAHDDRTHRHLALGGRLACQSQCLTHEALVLRRGCFRRRGGTVRPSG